jgi:uncharacterized protein
LNVTTKPVPVNERIASLDILRGFALLGIILVNVLGFNASFFDFGGYYGSLPDASQQNFYNIYISLTADKFIFLFSFLFGYGIYMQYRKFTNRGENFTPFLSRRMYALALFGIAHILFLWAGDILVLYAIAGFVVMPLLKLSTKWQIIIALFFYFFIGLWLAIGVWIPLPMKLSSTCTECLEQAKIIYANGNYFDCLKLRMQEYYAFRDINIIYYLPKIIGVVMLGLIASKFNLHQKVADNRLKWILIFIAIVIIGSISYFGYEKIVDFESPFAVAVYMMGYEFMSLLVGFSYLLLLLIVASIKSMARLLWPIALMGRMSLTNYIMQSLIMSIIFYGWGFGLFGQTNVTFVVLIGIGVYLFQVILNIIWFRFYNQGPLEKLWRKISYMN